MNQKYMDTTLTPAERAEILISQMSLEEKMAQVNAIFPFGDTYKDLDKIAEDTKYGIGQVSTLEMRQIKTLEEAAAWTRTVQKIVMDNSPHHIPAVFHMEGLCGAFIQDATSFPSGIARGAGFHPQLEEEIAEIISRQEAACGITQTFAPVLDISRDSRMGRQGETYGEDPTLAAAMGVAYTRGIQKNETAGRRTESVAKHFLAFHNSQGGIHGTHSDTAPRTLEEIYGKPFQAAISEANLRGIMPCYCSIDGEPVSASRRFLTGLLREKMGFDGVCVSDYGGVGNSHSIQHIGETSAETGLRCMRAGMDVELPNTTGYGKELMDMFASGEADMEILDTAVRRVLTAKFRMGLFEHPFALEGEELHDSVCREGDRSVSLQSALESMVLLKNNGVLPLNREVKKIAVIGPHADYARKYFGAYTHMSMMEQIYAIENSLAGIKEYAKENYRECPMIPGTQIQSDETEEFESIIKSQKPDCISLRAQLKRELPHTEVLYAYGYPVAGADETGFADALQAAKEADVIILTLGGKNGTGSVATMGEGVDASDINLPKCQDAFIRAAAKLGKPLVGVHFNGRPVSSDVADTFLDAIVEAWNPSETGAEAVVKVLLGEYNPGGKLPVSVAYHAGQIPIYYNHPYGSAWSHGQSIGFQNYVENIPHTPRYYFGHGLSYTEFTYSGLQISKEEIMSDETVTIELDVENSGKCAGDEVVQLYLSDVYASMTRPVKELAGFVRIHLKPGEKKHVAFKVNPSQMAFLDEEMRWKIEKGRIEVGVGSSSKDIRLQGAYQVMSDQWIDGRERSFSAACYINNFINM